MPGHDWTRDEVALVVGDYFVMLEAELKREPYSKAGHDRGLQAATGRSKGSIEFKHQNVSAVLVNFRLPFIAGYLPRQNYQSSLEQAVLEWLAANPRFFVQLADGPLLDPVARPAVPPGVPPSRLVEPPPLEAVCHRVSEGDINARFVRLDFARRDAEKSSPGSVCRNVSPPRLTCIGSFSSRASRGCIGSRDPSSVRAAWNRRSTVPGSMRPWHE